MLPVKRFSLHNEMKSQIHSLKQFGQEKKLDQTEFENSQPEKADTLNSSHRKKSVSLMRFISHENDQLISLQEAQQILNLFFNNQFDKADNLTEKFLQFQSNVLYIKFVRAIGAFVQAVVIQDKVSSFFLNTHRVYYTHFTKIRFKILVLFDTFRGILSGWFGRDLSERSTRDCRVFCVTYTQTATQKPDLLKQFVERTIREFFFDSKFE